jgi:phenylalanine-4-hydroxylase
MDHSLYIAKIPDSEGYVNYTDEENSVWKTLYQRQLPLIEERACSEYLAGFAILGLKADAVPQLPDLNKVLLDKTGWSMQAVKTTIPFSEFFELLANKKFPAATFIRRREELDYLQEPDIFHEIFGHGPLLTNQVFADFCESYGKLGVKATKEERVYLARLFWFTVEFGLIDTPHGLRIYGAGIMSSMGETVYSLDSNIPVRRTFSSEMVLRTPYRTDVMQTIYYVVKDFKDIYQVMNESIKPLIYQSMELGNFEPSFKLKQSESIAKGENLDNRPSC